MAPQSDPGDIDWNDLMASMQAEVRQKLGTLVSDTRTNRTSVVFNSRLTSTAGRARLDTCIIELNPRLVALGDAQLNQTLWHEAAHLLAHMRHAKRRIAPHGKEWKQACSDLGIPGAKATHRLPLPRTKQRPKFLYRCPACGNEIKRVRKINARAACHPCCVTHNDGRYSKKFQLDEYAIPWTPA